MENEKSNINYEKFYLLRDIKELNSKISRKQRAELYDFQYK